MNTALQQINMERYANQRHTGLGFLHMRELERSCITRRLSYNLRQCTQSVSFTSIELPTSLKEIQGVAFWGCDNLRFITYNATTPPTLVEDMIFPNKVYRLTVPTGYADTYKGTAWNNYFENIQ